MTWLCYIKNIFKEACTHIYTGLLASTIKIAELGEQSGNMLFCLFANVFKQIWEPKRVSVTVYTAPHTTALSVLVVRILNITEACKFIFVRHPAIYTNHSYPLIKFTKLACPVLVSLMRIN